MTELQIKYQQLELDRQRVAREQEIAQGQLSEAIRHNVATEAVAQEQAKIAQHQADSARMNAETNRLNYGVNYLNAQSNARNAESNRMNAETNRLNYGVNARNAAINAMNAATNARNAAVNERQVALAERYQPYQIAATQADTRYKQAQAQDLADKSSSGYWSSQTYRNYMGRLDSAAVSTVPSFLKGAGAAKAASTASKTVTNAAKAMTVPTTGKELVQGSKTTIPLNPAFLGVMYDGLYMPPGTPGVPPSISADLMYYLETGKHIPSRSSTFREISDFLQSNPEWAGYYMIDLVQNKDGSYSLVRGRSGSF